MPTGSSRDPEEGPPSFFKVIRYPSAPHLSLPKAFVRKYLEKIPKNPTLVTARGEHSWRLEISKIDEDYCFVNGWERLAKDVQLCIKDIALFWLSNPSTFRVTFFGANGCEKDLPVNKSNTDDDDDAAAAAVKDDSQDDGIVGECHDEVMPDSRLCFQKVISCKRFSKYYTSLPMGFVRAAGVEHEPIMKLKDLEGREWQMRLFVNRSVRARYYLSKGWKDFRRFHKLLDGDVCKFKFDKKEGVLNLTHLFRAKRQIKQETSRLPCYGGRTVEIEDGWSPTEKPCSGGGVKVKIEDDMGPEMEVVKRKSEMPPWKSCVNVKIGDGLDPEMAVVSRKRRPPEKASPHGGVEVNAERGIDGVLRSKHLIYF